MTILSSLQGESFLKNTLKKILPVFIFLAFAGTSVHVKVKLDDKDRSIVLNNAQGVATQIALRLQDAVNNRIMTLEIMADRLSSAEDFNRKDFIDYSSKVQNTFTGFQAINWIDERGIIRWIYPVDPNREAQYKDLHLHHEEPVRIAFRQAENLKIFSITPAIELFQGGQGIATYFPLKDSAGEYFGYLNGVFRIGDLVNACLPDWKDSQPLHFTIFEGDKEIYHSAPLELQDCDAEEKGKRECLSEMAADIDMKGNTWTLAVCTKTFPQLNSAMSPNNMLLMFGIMISLGLATLVYFLIRRSDQNRRAKETAERAQKFSANILSTMPSALLVVDKSFMIKLANTSFIAYCIPGTDDAAGRKLLEVLDFKFDRDDATGDSKCPFCYTMKDLFERGKAVHNHVIRMTSKAGEEKWIRLSCVPIGNTEKTEALIVFNDISEQRKLEKAYEQRREYIETILRDAPDAVITINTDKDIVEWNPGAERLFGYKSEETVGKNIELLLGEPDSFDKTACISNVLETGESIAPGEAVRYGKNRKPLDLIVTASPIYDGGELSGVVGIFTDITALKKVSKALEEREEVYGKFIQLSSEAIWRFDFEKPLPIDLPVDEQLDWGYQYAWLADCNDAMARMYGLESKEQIIGARLNDLLPRSDQRNIDYLTAVIENNYQLDDVESYELDKDGEIIIFSNNMTGVAEDGKLVHLWGTQRDITKRKLAEEALKASEEKYRTLIDTAPEIVYTLDPDSVITSVNPIFEKISGFKTEEWIGKKFTEFVHEKDLKLAEISIIRTLQGKSAEPIELRLRHRDGSYRIMEVIAARMTENEQATGIVGVTRDITEQKHAQTRLSESEQRYRTLVETSPDAILLTDLSGKILMINQRGLEILGALSPEQVIGRIPFDYISDEDKKKLRFDIESIITTGRGKRIEYMIPRTGESLTPVEANISLVNDAGGSPQGFIVMARDITARREAEVTREAIYNIANSVNITEDLSALIDNIRLELGRLMDTTNFFIALYNAENDTISIPYIKDQKDKFENYPAGKTLASHVINNNEALLVDEDQVSAMIKRGEIEQHGTISKVWLGVPLKMSGRVVGVVVVQNYHSKEALTGKHLEILKFVSDQIALAIQRKKSEDALRHSEARYRTVVEGSLNGIAIADDNYKILFANQECANITGYQVPEIINQDFRKFIFHENLESVSDRYKRRQLGEIVPQQYEFNIITKTLELRTVEIISKVLKDSKDNIQSIIQIRDVTEQKKAETALKSSEQLNRGIVTNAPVGILYLDQDGRIIYENPAMIKMTGRAESRSERIVGRLMTEFDAILSDVSGVVRSLLAGNPVSGFEMECKTPAGEIRKIELHGSPRKGADGDLIGAVIMCFDLTEYKAMEVHLRHAQKMEAIGTLAGGIAHDFNNLLTGIMGNVELAMLTVDPKDDIYGKLAQMQKSAERAAELTAQLLAFGRQRMERPKPVNLNTAIDEAVSFIKHTIDKKVEVELIKESSLWVVKADLGQMNQILINLMVNAADAMIDGGLLKLKSSNVIIDKKYCQTHADARPGDFVKIEITDTGQGIPANVIDRIFEPFFTTKPVGKGTGLGLAMVYGIARGHEGWIEVKSKIGKGTTFEVYLPRAAQEIDTVVETKASDLKGGIETILLVDDEDIVRMMGQTMLVRFGYKVMLAENGQEALEVYRDSREQIGLVILDVTMPKKSGRETLVELIEMNPDIKVVVSSGFDRSGPVEELMRLGASGFVQKPYKIGDMLQVVRGVLDV